MKNSQIVPLMGSRRTYTAGLDVDDSEWHRVSTRNIHAPLIDIYFLERLHDSVEKIFIPWFTRTGEYLDANFREALRAQHELFVEGANGKPVYHGASRVLAGATNRSTTPPGVYRHEDDRRHGALAFRFRELLDKNLVQELSEIVDLYWLNISDNIVIPPSAISDPTPDRSPIFSAWIFPRLGRSMNSWSEYFPDHVNHYYPNSENIPAILTAMEDVLSDINEITSIEDISLETLAPLLAEFVYLGSRGHLFAGANFSLIMANANRILHLNGFRGISHGYLDLSSLAIPFRRFSEHFCDEAYSANDMERPDRPDESIGAELSVIAHISRIGDLAFGNGEWIMDGEDRKPIEGFSIWAMAMPPGVFLKYASLSFSEEQPVWVGPGVFVGSRGRSTPLQNLVVCLEGPESIHFRVDLKVRRNPFTGSLVGFHLSINKANKLD